MMSKKLDNLIDSDINNISSYIKVSLNTFKKFKPYIINAVKYKYTNGVIEGINNKIKAIKRVAFGYLSFFNFRNRILIMNHLIYIKKRCRIKIIYTAGVVNFYQPHQLTKNH